jgi:glycosyltransferase involved in cell wall biosynthesis
MKTRIEISSLASKNLSGVSNYTKLLAEALDKHTETDGVYFNFLDRQPEPNLSLKKPLIKNCLIPLRVYAKLQSYNIAPPFDIFLPKTDLTIFPNFATWPTIKSKVRATVIHDLTYLYYPELVDYKNLKHLRRVIPRSIKNADFIITVSEAVKSELIKEFSINPENCIVTTIPPDSNYLIRNNNEVHKKYKIPTLKYIYFIGNLEPRKDLPTLTEAYRNLPNNIKKEYSLVLACGNGWKTEKSRQSIKSAQEAGENVINIGFVEAQDRPAIYQKASVLVMPSLYEGFGMPILEAMASGCPVIASDIPVLRESGGNAALFAKAGDSDSFSFNIKKLLNDKLLQKELAEKGKQHLKNFSWDKNVEKIIDQTNKLLSIKK